MTALATAFVEIRPDTAGFGARLSTSVRGDADRAGRTAGSRFSTAMKNSLKLGGVLAGAFAATQGVKFFKGAIEEARDAQKVGAQTAAVLKSTQGAAGLTEAAIGRLAGAISNKTAIDDEAIQSGANLLLTFTNIRNEAGKGNDIFNQTTQVMTDLSAATGQSMKSSAIQLGKALNDPIKGVTALSRVGVSFTEVQKTQIARMVETGDTMGAQRVILRELNKEFAGSAEAQATPAERAQVAWGNFQESIGTMVLPMLDKLLNWFVDEGLPGVQRFGGWLEDNVLPTLRDLGGFIGGTVVPALANMGEWIGRNTDWLIPLVAGIGAGVAVIKTISIVTRTWAAAQALLNIALAANPIGIVVVAIAALATGLVVAYKRSETFRNIVNGAWQVVKDGAQGLWDKVSSFFGWLSGAFKKVGGLAGDFRRAVGDAWDAVKRATQLAALFVVEKVLWLADKMLAAMAKAFGWVPGIGPKLKRAASEVAAFREAVNDEMDKIRDETVNVVVRGSTSMSGGHTSRGEIPLPPTKRALGGPIFGGVPGKDSVRALLMPGEHVWTADEVKRAGGHAAIFSLRKAVKAGALQLGTIPVADEGRPLGFAAGGPVFDVKTRRPPLGPITSARDAMARREVEAMRERLREAVERAQRAAAAAAASGAGTPNGNGGLGPAAIRAANFVRSHFGFGGTIGGYSYRNIAGTSTLSKHALGKAIDIMTAGPLAQSMFNYFSGPGYSRFGVDNVIYNRRIFNRSGGNHYYSGVSPHTDHVHVDFYDKGGLARGAGLIPKRTTRPERVLSPRQTEAFERLVTALESGGTSGVNIQQIVTHDPAAVGRSVRREQEKARALAAMP